MKKMTGPQKIAHPELASRLKSLGRLVNALRAEAQALAELGEFSGVVNASAKAIEEYIDSVIERM